MGASCSACMKPASSKESDNTYLKPTAVIAVKEELVDKPVEQLKKTSNEAVAESQLLKEWLNEQEWIEKIKNRKSFKEELKSWKEFN